jgi:hypothetical protein
MRRRSEVKKQRLDDEKRNFEIGDDADRLVIACGLNPACIVPGHKLHRGLLKIGLAPLDRR